MHVRDLAGCHDCFEASLSAVRSGAAGRLGAANSSLQRRRVASLKGGGAQLRSNNSLQRTAVSIKCQGPLPRRAAAAELNR